MRKKALITGASDGIGKALALELAQRDYDLILCARRQEKLDALRTAINEQCPTVTVNTALMDVTNTAQVEQQIQALADSAGGVDLVCANAGIAYAGKVGSSPLEEHLNVINTNVNGAIATLSGALQIFRKQGHGHLVGISSVAAYRGMPRNAAYCASKAALSVFMEALRAETAKEDIDITVIHPGFIDTEINRSLPHRPFVSTVEKCAKLIANLIEQKVKRSTVPQMPWSMIAPVLKWLPDSVVAKL